MTQRYGLNPERVDTVMDDIQQIFDEHAEIEASMSQPLSPQADISQQELESELDEILAGYSPQTTPKKVPQQSPEPHQELVNAMCRMRLGGCFQGLSVKQDSLLEAFHSCRSG